ncbi:hypothetical protein Tco_0926783 [Tanacetum coccineum]|uniref:Reverse transcriptase domain-containing protein n=1 Tax=Tanacetum coccineum TaxID=301880 RepID=A0ABQ5DBM4_9ASTR
MRNTIGKDKQTPQGSARTTSAINLEEFCEKHYKKLLPIMADKYEYEKRKKEKLEEVKARLDFGDARKKSTRAQESAYSESWTISPRRQRRSRSPRHNPSVFTRLRHERSRSPGMNTRVRKEERAPCSRDSEAEDGVHPRTPIAVRKGQGILKITLKVKIVKVGTGSLNHEGKSPVLKMMISPNLGKDPEDHLKIFQAAAKTERWAMPTWCHMFNSTLTKNAQKKCIKDPIVLHNIKQRDGESTEDFIQSRRNDAGGHVFSSRARGRGLNKKGKKSLRPGDTRKGVIGIISKKGGGFRSQHKTEKRPDRFTLLTKTPKEILALEKGKFKTPPPMTTPVEKRNANKFCEFHGEVGHNTDECNHLRKQIEDMLKVGKMSHIIRELKQSSGKEQPKKKGETSGKEKPQAILMIQPRQKAVR